MFVVVNVDDDEEDSTNDEGEDSLDLSNMFDEMPQDTDDITETIDALAAKTCFPPWHQAQLFHLLQLLHHNSHKSQLKISLTYQLKSQVKQHQKNPLALLQAGRSGSPQGSSKCKV